MYDESSNKKKITVIQDIDEKLQKGYLYKTFGGSFNLRLNTSMNCNYLS